jgi:hypothetical protein
MIGNYQGTFADYAKLYIKLRRCANCIETVGTCDSSKLNCPPFLKWKHPGNKIRENPDCIYVDKRIYYNQEIKDTKG